ncbi:TIGR00266 family protein [Permianibacter sp. IMCC34836]|uniref:TIGR00266 family protein n=1 Tax=Permianibacter fluminis TaxID=2738515 RepID=UPI0015535C50|nr:TIGR00266 family protein [Permianibacter fluminis]NQD35683.1 TIGR00266 family protein [Permianibacter fluminis]
MHIEFSHQPGNTAARIQLAQGESCTAESGAMIAMSGNMDITTTTHKKGSGSVMKAVKRLLSGESLFLNHFEPRSGNGEVWLGSTLAGDMMEYQLNNESLIVQSGSFLACESGIEIDLGWQGFKSLLSGESVFWLNLKGKGKVVLSSFGAIYPVQVNGEYIVDTGHIVAFNETLDFSLTKAGKSWIHSMLGGEGLVCKFKGRGTVWCQSHNPSAFGKAFGPKLRPRR